MSENDRFTIENAYEVYADSLLPEFNTPTAQAYAVRPLESEIPTMFGLLCDPRLTARLDFFKDACSITSAGFMRAVHWAVVKWPETGAEHLFLIYQMPKGGQVAAALRETGAGFAEDKVIQALIVPAVEALDILNSYKKTHRSIRFENLYFTDETKSAIVIGDASSGPPAYAQAAQFEAVPIAAADPEARGEGTQADDIYALGVTILSLLLGKPPMETEEPGVIIQEKIAKSSFAALMPKTRFQFNITELLRGMLHDDPQLRWNLRDIDAWLNGRQSAPKQLAQVKRAAVALQIGTEKAENARIASYFLGNDWPSAAPIIRAATFDKWLNDSLNDSEVLGHIRAVVGPNQFVRDINTIPNETLVTNMCIALDPTGPIRHHGMAVQLAGVGTALAAHTTDERKLNVLTSIIRSRFAKNWVALQSRSQSEYLPLLSVFEGLPALLDTNNWGDGLERVLYKLNPNSHCLSPLLVDAMVFDAADLLRGLDAAAVTQDQSQLPFDKHIAAFMMAHNFLFEQEEFDALNGEDVPPILELLTALSILARLQKDLELPPVPNLCAWFVSLASVVFEQFHNLRTREAMSKKISAVGEKGILSDILDLLNDGSALQKDRVEFSRAVKAYSSHTEQVNSINKVLENRSMIAHEIGDQVAAIIAGIIGAVGSSVIFILWAIGKG